MKLLNGNGDTLAFLPTPGTDGGTFTAMIEATETLPDGEVVEVTYLIRPDEALALATVLREWAEIETGKAGGLF